MDCNACQSMSDSQKKLLDGPSKTHARHLVGMGVNLGAEPPIQGERVALLMQPKCLRDRHSHNGVF